jgi:hypothetical protein
MRGHATKLHSVVRVKTDPNAVKISPGITL